MFSLPLKKRFRLPGCAERELAADFNSDKLLNQFRGAYARAPHFAETFPLLEQVMRHRRTQPVPLPPSLDRETCEHLGISTAIVVSSEHRHRPRTSRARTRCLPVRGGRRDTYVNPIGGIELYSRDDFRARAST